MRPRDTSQAAHELQIRIYRSMKDEERAEMAFRMSESVRSIAREGIRQRHPDYDDAQVHRALVALLYGAEIAVKIWPNLSVPRP